MNLQQEIKRVKNEIDSIIMLAQSGAEIDMQTKLRAALLIVYSATLIKKEIEEINQYIALSHPPQLTLIAKTEEQKVNWLLDSGAYKRDGWNEDCLNYLLNEKTVVWE